MIDVKQEAIKDRILKFAMDQWGVKNARDMDPVVDLLLDVFAYETARLHNDIITSDSVILHRLAGLLIDRKWTLPFPSHALLSVSPNPGETCLLSAEDHFYAEKFVYGHDETQVFFTPLYPVQLINAKVETIFTPNMLRWNVSDKIERQSNIQIASGKYSQDNVMWVGIDIPDTQIENLEKLTICLLPEDWGMIPFLKIAKFYAQDDSHLEAKNGIDAEDRYGNAQYFDEIKEYYSDLFFNLDLGGIRLQKCTINQLLSNIELDNDCQIAENKFLWIKIVFPEVFQTQQLNRIKVLVNTIPVVNRKLVSQQHNFKTNGNIIPLYTDSDSQLLNIRCLQDDSGREYIDRLNQLELSAQGVFSLYFGNLERFDSINAKSQIVKLIQLIKEEGNAFASVDSDALTTHLKGLFDKIQSIEKMISSSVDEKNLTKSFALTVPYRDATYAEIRYWITTGELANGIPRNTLLQQFNMDKVDGSSIYFRTSSTGARSTYNEGSFTRGLRYGLITRERIVSKEDIKSFIVHKLGNYIESVTIKNGVALSKEPKKGLIRVTDVFIRFSPGNQLDVTEASALSNILQKELAERSIAGSSYRIFVK